MTHHLAAELRGILDDLHDAEHGAVPKPLVRERLGRLAEHVEQATPNPLAASIRHINSTSFEPEDRERYVENLAQRVEHAADQPVEVDASTELTATFGLEPDQEIRDRALDSAARLLAPALGGWSPLGVEDNLATIARLWIELAQYGEAWVSTGGACGCTVVDDPECPLHGGEPRRRSTDR